MANKGKVAFIRTTDFESVDEELTAALNRLEDANERIVQLLESQTNEVDSATETQDAKGVSFAEMGEEEPTDPPGADVDSGGKTLS